MPLTPCADLTPADWLTTSDLPWHQLVTFGPAGFEACVRLRFIRDPQYRGQSEADGAQEDAPSEGVVLQKALELLRQHTSAEDWYFCVWDGWGWEVAAPKVQVPNRAYFVLRGTIEDWAASQGTPVPAFVWPADRAWCLANDVDPHYAGIGAGDTAVEALLAHPDLDVVRADPRLPQPSYY